MSEREEDKRKKECSSSGIGVAAAAVIGVGVGVGAALYYLFKRREEIPSTSTSTTNWNEPQQTLSEQEPINSLRQQAFRERAWSLEECSICFDVMLQDQELMALSCAHNFHTECIMPWLQEKQTCPNCRKMA